jgi:hypothetical protein
MRVCAWLRTPGRPRGVRSIRAFAKSHLVGSASLSSVMRSPRTRSETAHSWHRFRASRRTTSASSIRIERGRLAAERRGPREHPWTGRVTADPGRSSRTHSDECMRGRAIYPYAGIRSQPWSQISVQKPRSIPDRPCFPARSRWRAGRHPPGQRWRHLLHTAERASHLM